MTQSHRRTDAPPRSSERGEINRVSFDEQAGTFERRAGLPDGVPEQVAEAVRDYAGLQPDDLLVEIGAGTGLIGQWLAQLPIRYHGLDSSQPMLDVFAPRLPRRDQVRVQFADANQRWPVADGTAHAVFGSRVFQLLDIAHLVREAHRVAHPDRAMLIQGRLILSPDSPKNRARHKLYEVLTARGLHPRPAERLLQRVLELAEAEGGSILPPRTVATWQRTQRPPEALDDWRQKWSMGGLTPPPDVHAEVLAELDAWTAEAYADPTEPVTAEEKYVLEGVQLRPPRS